MSERLRYNRLAYQYNRTLRRLKNLAGAGKNSPRQNLLKKRLERWYQTLMNLQRAIRFGVAGAACSTALVVGTAETADAQNFGPAQSNPFNLAGGAAMSPDMVDIDNDGDLDMLGGQSDGNFLYYENIGTASTPNFTTAQNNPFSLQDIGFHAANDFADLDDDGDLDMIATNNYGYFHYFENTGSVSAASFPGFQMNPFGLDSVGMYSTPAFVDLDDDGDFDIMVGSEQEGLSYFENTGTANSPAFAAPVNGPFGIVTSNNRITPDFADLDADGDLDLLCGEFDGEFIYYENTGDTASPAFAAVQTNPFSLTDIGLTSVAAFADLDNDGDQDLMAGNLFSTLEYFENISSLVSVPQLSEAAFSIYPTAVTDLLTVNTEGAGQLHVINSMGQVVHRQPIQNTTTGIQLSSLAPGAYLVTFQDARGATRTERFVKR